METLRQDVALAIRYLRKTPGFTIPAALTLALGIGANTTIFSLADALLFRRLAVADADRIVHVYQSRPNRPPSPFGTSLPDYFEYRDASRSFDVLAAHYPTAPMHVVVDGDPESTTGSVVTANYFDVLRMRPAAGRFFRADEDQVRDRDAVAVIGFGYWQRRLGGAPGAVGTVIQINGRSFTVVGVAPRGFMGVRGRDHVDLWIPSAMFANGYRYCDAFDRDCRIVQLLGRLKEGIELPAAQIELDVIANGLAAAYPNTNAGLGVDVVEARGLGYAVAADELQQLRLFLLVVGVVLLMACANVTGLLMTRASGRRKELAMRLALGATRWRLFRQLLTETAVLAALGTTCGLLAASWGNALLESAYGRDSAGRPLDFPMTISSNVFLATAALAALSTVLVGLLPSFTAGRGDVVTALKDESGSGGGRRSKARLALVTGQVAASVTLLIGAVLLLQSVWHLNHGATSITDHVATFRLRPSLVEYSRDRAHAFQRRALEAIQAVPGVTDASPAVYMAVIGGGGGFGNVSLDSAATEDRRDVLLAPVGANYFRTMGVPLLQGRDFTDRDDGSAPRVAIINDVLAGRLFPDVPALGRTVYMNQVPHVVVGICRDAQYYSSGERRRSQIFTSYWQPLGADPFYDDARMMVRTAGDPAPLMDAIRRAIIAVDPAVPISEAAPMRDRVSYTYQGVRLARTMMAGFAVLALVLSAVGVYGVLAFSVAQRVREMAIRTALGASRADVAALVLRDGIIMAGAGVAIGLVAASSGSRFISALLYGIEPDNVTAFVIGPAALLLVTIVASAIPARRAAAVSASAALRCD
jgi:predicted permease